MGTAVLKIYLFLITLYLEDYLKFGRIYSVQNIFSYNLYYCSYFILYLTVVFLRKLYKKLKASRLFQYGKQRFPANANAGNSNLLCRAWSRPTFLGGSGVGEEELDCLANTSQQRYTASVDVSVKVKWEL